MHITTLQNGCICCNSHAELGNTLLALLKQLDSKQLDFTQLVIECTEMAGPAPIIQTFLTHNLFSEHFQLHGVITLVNAINAPYQFKHFHITQTQVGYAGLILLSKTDLLEESHQKFLELLRHMNTKAKIHCVINSKIDLAYLNQLDAFSLSSDIASPYNMPKNIL